MTSDNPATSDAPATDAEDAADRAEAANEATDDEGKPGVADVDVDADDNAGVV